MKLAIFIVPLSLLAIVVLSVVIIRGHHAAGGVDGRQALTQNSISTAVATNFPEAIASRYGFGSRPGVFGPYWDSVPSPTITGSNRMAAVEAFVATNGWNMSTGVL